MTKLLKATLFFIALAIMFFARIESTIQIKKATFVNSDQSSLTKCIGRNVKYYRSMHIDCKRFKYKNVNWHVMLTNMLWGIKIKKYEFEEMVRA